MCLLPHMEQTDKATRLSCRCHQCASVCAVCHHVVKGLFVWCQGCSHGGHLEHIMNWLKSSSHCPAGCGHLCEYTWASHSHCSHSWFSVGEGYRPGSHTNMRCREKGYLLFSARPGVFCGKTDSFEERSDKGSEEEGVLFWTNMWTGVHVWFGFWTVGEFAYTEVITAFECVNLYSLHFK